MLAGKYGQHSHSWTLYATNRNPFYPPRQIRVIMIILLSKRRTTTRVANVIIIIIYPLTARVVGAPQTISQPVSSIFPVLHCPRGLGELQACPFSPLSLSALSSSPFTVPCKMVFARPDERGTCPYHCSLRLFTVVRRSV